METTYLVELTETDLLNVFQALYSSIIDATSLRDRYLEENGYLNDDNIKKIHDILAAKKTALFRLAKSNGALLNFYNENL